MADVLVVDDDRDVAELVADMLEEEGHQVRVASDGEAGLRAMAARIPDVALLDVEMPLLGGPEMAYEMFIRDCGLEAVPIVLLSGVVEISRIAARVGTTYFLGKPYGRKDLLAVVDKALAERRPPAPRL